MRQATKASHNIRWCISCLLSPSLLLLLLLFCELHHRLSVTLNLRKAKSITGWFRCAGETVTLWYLYRKWKWRARKKKKVIMIQLTVETLSSQTTSASCYPFFFSFAAFYLLPHFGGLLTFFPHISFFLSHTHEHTHTDADTHSCMSIFLDFLSDLLLSLGGYIATHYAFI